MSDRDALAQKLDDMRANGNVRRAYTDDLFARIWEAARAEALEEAAAVAEYHGDWAIAQDITAMKDAVS
jgi:hypothetical protein